MSRFGSFISLSAFAIVMILSSASGRDRFTEYEFQCGALYAILWKMHEFRGEEEKSQAFREKFNDLSAKSTERFIAEGKSARDAEAYMQQHVDDLVRMSSNDGRILPGFEEVCRTKSP